MDSELAAKFFFLYICKWHFVIDVLQLTLLHYVSMNKWLNTIADNRGRLEEDVDWPRKAFVWGSRNPVARGLFSVHRPII